MRCLAPPLSPVLILRPITFICNIILCRWAYHNQRIEPLWRDMYNVLLFSTIGCFYFMERHGLLNPLNEYHVSALHFVFVPRISKSLNEFTQSWNNHPICTTGHKSPNQLFSAGAILVQNSQIAGLDFSWSWWVLWCWPWSKWSYCSWKWCTCRSSIESIAFLKYRFIISQTDSWSLCSLG